MKRKRKRTPEEYRAWLEARMKNERELREMAERIRLELEAKKRPA